MTRRTSIAALATPRARKVCIAALAAGAALLLPAMAGAAEPGIPALTVQTAAGGGQTYTLTVESRRNTFAPLTVSVTGQSIGADMIADQ